MSGETEHRPAFVRNRIWLISPLTLLAGGVDLAIVYLWLSGRIDTGTALLEHFLAAVVICTVAILWQRRVSAETVVIGAAMLLLGPLGGIVLLIVELGSGSHRFETQPPERDRDVQSNAVRRLTGQIQQNRRPALQGVRPASFAQVLRLGTLAQQQDAIAAILRYYEPELLPLLRQALGSPVPAIRVQAAAVYAKLRGSFEARAKAALAAADSPAAITDARAFAAEVEAVAVSGFADAETQTLLRAAAAQVLRGAENDPETAKHGARRADAAPVQSGLRAGQAPSLKRYSCGGIA